MAAGQVYRCSFNDPSLGVQNGRKQTTHLKEWWSIPDCALLIERSIALPTLDNSFPTRIFGAETFPHNDGVNGRGKKRE